MTGQTAGSTGSVCAGVKENNASGGFIKRLGDQGLGVIVDEVFPYGRSIVYALVKEAQEMVKAKGMSAVSPAMLEGFAAAKILLEGLRRAGVKPSRDKIQAALMGIRKLGIGGLEVRYSPGDHTGLDFADVSIIGSEGKFKK